MANKNKKKSFLDGICAFIPRYVSNTFVLFSYRVLRVCTGLLPGFYGAHLHSNEGCMEQHTHIIEAMHGFIEDQYAYQQLQYGRTTLAAAGCGVIAVYNALHALDETKHPSLPGIIDDFEKDGIVAGGRLGSDPQAISKYMRQLGYDTWLSSSEKEYLNLSERSRALILTMYNDRNDIRGQLHTICITRSQGMWVAHNMYLDGTVGPSFRDILSLIRSLREGKVKPLCLIGIAGKKILTK